MPRIAATYACVSGSGGTQRQRATAAGPGVVRRQRQLDRAEAPQQIAHEVRLGVDGGARIERIAQADRARRRRHELGDAQRSCARTGERVESRLAVGLRSEQRRGDVPALCGAPERGGELRRDEIRHTADGATVLAVGDDPARRRR